MEGKWAAYAECENARIAEVRTDAKGSDRQKRHQIGTHVSFSLGGLAPKRISRSMSRRSFLISFFIRPSKPGHRQNVFFLQRCTKGKKELSDANHDVQKGGRFDYALPG